MKRIILLCLCFSGTMLVFAAKNIERVSTTYEYYSNNPNESPEQAERIAIERAKQKALEEKFGVDVTNITNTILTNRSGKGKSESTSNVFSMGETAVRGEWVETLKEQVLEKSFSDGFWHVKVYVEGNARNYSTEKVDIQYAFVRDIQDVESPVTFRDGNDIFLRFNTPVAGQLCVYLIDEEQNAYCILPYASNSLGAQIVESNKEYIFFSHRFDANADEYTLNCQHSTEQNMLYVVFSPNDFTKAADKQGGKNFRDEQLPRVLTYETLMKWLSRNQTKDPDMVVRREIITIRK